MGVGQRDSSGKGGSRTAPTGMTCGGWVPASARTTGGGAGMRAGFPPPSSRGKALRGNDGGGWVPASARTTGGGAGMRAACHPVPIDPRAPRRSDSSLRSGWHLGNEGSFVGNEWVFGVLVSRGFSFGEDSFVITSVGLFWGVSGVDLDDLRGGLVLFFLCKRVQGRGRAGVGSEDKLAALGRMNVHRGDGSTR